MKLHGDGVTISSMRQRPARLAVSQPRFTAGGYRYDYFGSGLVESMSATGEQFLLIRDDPSDTSTDTAHHRQFQIASELAVQIPRPMIIRVSTTL